MKRTQRREARRLLTRNVRGLAHAPSAGRPNKGWVRSVRDALGFSARQLAERLDVSTAAVANLEESERADTAQLATLRRAADAMGCDLVYAFVPRHGFDDIVAKRATMVAEHEMRRVNVSMRLEDQELSPDMQNERVNVLAQQLIDDPSLWNSRDGLDT